MQITNELSLPVPPEEAWSVLLDLERIAPCLPGASITGVDGDSYEGKAKVKVGPITAEYRGVASFVEVDEKSRRAVIKATGKDARGQGNVAATVTAQLVADGAGSKVIVNTELDITGKVAQFGRGVINDAASAILATFAERLADLMTAPAASEGENGAVGANSTSATNSTSAVSAPAYPDEPLDLLKVAKAARAQRSSGGQETGFASAPATMAACVSVIAAAVAVFAAGIAIGRASRP